MNLRQMLEDVRRDQAMVRNELKWLQDKEQEILRWMLADGIEIPPSTE